MELLPCGRGGAVRLPLIARGAPPPDAEVTVIVPDGSKHIVTTDVVTMKWWR